jgi:hypothetical protein
MARFNTKGWVRAGARYQIRPPSHDYARQRTWSLLELIGMLIIATFVALYMVGLFSCAPVPTAPSSPVEFCETDTLYTVECENRP